MKAVRILLCAVVWAGTPLAETAIVDVLTLKKTDGSTHQVRTGDARATAVVFVSAECPMSLQYPERLAKLAADYAGKGIQFLLVNSNVNETNEEVEKQRTAAGIALPIYRDPAAALAEFLGAVATPTAVVIDQTGARRYRGMIDNSRDPSRVTKELLRMALDAVLAGRPVEIAYTRVIGCTIKAAALP